MLKDVAIGVVANLVSNRILEKKVIQTIPKQQIDEKEQFNEDEEPIAYSKQLSIRLLETIELLSLRFKELSYSKICDYLNWDSVTTVENYFNGTIEATYDFLKKYSDFFGIELHWLRHGEKHKFQILPKHETYATDYEEEIKKLKPQSVIFVRQNSEKGYAGIMLNLSDFKYIILPETYNISSYVGDTGQRQIFSFYKLVKSFSDSFSSFQKKGVILEKDEFDSLFAGILYPGKILDKYRTTNYWWDDLLDVNHKHPIAKDYEYWYGPEFIKAQDVIKRQLERNCA